MTLSADTLNQRSPYALTQLGDLTFRFVTDQLADRLSIDAERALALLYNSHTFVLLSNPDSGLQLQSDTYILNDLLRATKKCLRQCRKH